MTDDKAPGVYGEESDPRRRGIEAASTSVAAFVGFAECGPNDPTLVRSFTEYSPNFGGFAGTGYLSYAVRGFFQNGGGRCYVLNLPAGVSDASSALALLESLDDVSIVSSPDEHSVSGMTAALIEHCERMRYRIAVLGAPPGSDLSDAPGVHSSYAAYYAPWVMVSSEGGGGAKAVHPGGHVSGAIVANDLRRGVQQAPVNPPIEGIEGLERDITQQQQESLNPRGVNVIRNLPGRGYRIWGARTTSSDSEWKYVNIRRSLLYLEQSIDKGTKWAVFEPNGEQLWANVRETIENFLMNEWQSGVLLGNKPEQAYFVRCDRTTMSQDDIDNGRLVCLVGVAALKPAEFIVFRIGQWTADAVPCP
jgi:hypothetical protein